MEGRASGMGPSGGGLTNKAPGAERRLDFVIGIANMTWPGIAAVQSGFANLTAAGMRTTNVLNNSMLTLEAGMLAAGGAAALALGIMTYEAAKFEKQMKMVQSLIQNMNDSPMEIQTKMAEITKSAKQMAIEFGTSPEKVAQGFAVLGRAGLDTANEMNTVMKASMQLAKIEGISVADAATMTVQMTTLFGGDMARDAEKFAEILAHAANISTTSAKEIMTGMGYAGGIAATIWGNEDPQEMYRNASEMAAMIATLSQQGVSGPMAGTAIKSFANYMVKDMPKSKKALAMLGMSDKDFRDAEGNFKRFPEILDMLSAKFQYMKDQGIWKSDADIYKWFVKWGEPRQAQQYMKMFQRIPDPEAPNRSMHMYDLYNDKMSESYDMQEKVNIVMSSAAEKFNKVVSAISVFAINVGEKFLPVLGAIADVLEFITSNAAASEILAMATATGLFVLVMGGLYSVIKWLGPAFKEFGSVATLLARGKWKEAMAWEAEAAAVTTDTKAVQANTAAKVENAAVTKVSGAMMVEGSAADVARRAAMSGYYGPIPMGGGGFGRPGVLPPNTFSAAYPYKTPLIATKTEELKVLNKQYDALKSASAAQASWMAVPMSPSGKYMAGTTKSLDEAKKLAKELETQKNAAWAPLVKSSQEESYLANMARGDARMAQQAAKGISSGRQVYLDALLGAVMAEQSAQSLLKKNDIKANENLVEQKITHGKRIALQREEIQALKIQQREKNSVMKGIIAEEKKAQVDLRRWMGGRAGVTEAEMVGAERLRGVGPAMVARGSQGIGEAAMMAGMVAPNLFYPYGSKTAKPPAVLPSGAAPGETVKEIDARKAAYEREMNYYKSRYMPGLFERQNVESMMLRNRVKAKATQAGEGLLTAGMLASGFFSGKGVPGKTPEDPARFTKLGPLLGGVIVAAIAAAAVYSYGNDPSRQWWASPNDLRADYEKQQRRNLRWIQYEYSRYTQQEATLLRLKKEGYYVENQIAHARQMAQYYGGDKGEGGLYGQMKKQYAIQNAYSDTLASRVDYIKKGNEEVAQQLMTPPEMAPDIRGYTPGQMSSMGYSQTLYNQRQQDYLLGLPGPGQLPGMAGTDADFKSILLKRRYSGLYSGMDKSEGEFAATERGTRYLTEWNNAQAAYGEYLEKRNSANPWDKFIADVTMGDADYKFRQARWKFKSGAAQYDKDIKRYRARQMSPEEEKGFLANLQDVGPSSFGEAWDSDLAGPALMEMAFHPSLLGWSPFGEAFQSMQANMTPDMKKKFMDYRTGRGTQQTQTTVGTQVNIGKMNVTNVGVDGTPEYQKNIMAAGSADGIAKATGGQT